MPSTETMQRRSIAAASALPPLVGTVRAAVFVVLALVYGVLAAIAGSPALFMAPQRGIGVQHAWASGFEILMRIFLGQRIEVRGLENIPAGAALIAAKHASAVETLALVPLLRRPIYILKTSLMRIPLYGQYFRHFGSIPVDRAGGAAALAEVSRRAKQAAAEGGQVIIFPEGTRVRLGETGSYKSGVILLYRTLGVPCVPVAHNAGLFWPRGLLNFRRGTIVISFLPPLPPDLPRAAFTQKLKEAIEGETNRLLAEAGWSPGAIAAT